jgi:hypothetical protein
MAEWASYCNTPAASGREKVVRVRAPDKRERRDKAFRAAAVGIVDPPTPWGPSWERVEKPAADTLAQSI